MSNVEQPFMQGIDDGWNLKNYLNIQSTSLYLDKLCNIYTQGQDENEDAKELQAIKIKIEWCKDTSVLLSSICVMLLDSIHDFLVQQGKITKESISKRDYSHEITIFNFKYAQQEMQNEKLYHFAKLLEPALESLKVTNNHITHATIVGQVSGSEHNLSTAIEQVDVIVNYFCDSSEKFLELGNKVQTLGKAKNKKHWLGVYQSFGKASVDQIQKQLECYNVRMMELNKTDENNESAICESQASSKEDERSDKTTSSSKKKSFTKLISNSRLNLWNKQ
ncbi:hypothetical protein POMI540_0576 [Schizosaccharomyces pombe]